ncbi:hypothetical protein BFS14_14955 [Serratia fonticola]|uniref:fimbrial protein n=1 Tax=Serratia fonticola TaxID=47917 RepID=UPI0008FD5415|nr:fimbrial protein [Serratia fonticola]OIX95654.1 hypothetical protein BFS14_14955 [Serratia fonticola]QCR62166.1 type 1 fimbrial protein [Serratia fonticola]
MRRLDQKVLNLLLMAVLSVTGFASSLVAYAAGDSVDLTFKYTVLQGTCTVSVGEDGSSGQLNFGPIDTSSISTTNWTRLNASATKNFQVVLSNCSGSAISTKTPALTLTGQTSLEPTRNDANRKFLFVDPSSSAKWVGFAIYNKTGSTLAGDLVPESTQAAATDLARTFISIPGYGLNSAPTGTLPPINLTAIVTCGQVCDKTKMRAGDLKAQVTFNFVYH